MNDDVTLHDDKLQEVARRLGLARRSGSTSSARRRPWWRACGRSRAPTSACWVGYGRRGSGPLRPW